MSRLAAGSWRTWPRLALHTSSLPSSSASCATFAVARCLPSSIVTDTGGSASVVRSSFSTTGLASTFASAHHELATQLDRAQGRATAMTETLVFDGETRHTEALLAPGGVTIAGQAHAVPEQQSPHTMHSALG